MTTIYELYDALLTIKRVLYIKQYMQELSTH